MSKAENKKPDNLLRPVFAADLETEQIKTKKTNKFYPGLYHVFVFDEMGSKQELHFGDTLIESERIGIKESMKYNGSYVVTHVCYNSLFEGNRNLPSDILAKMDIPVYKTTTTQPEQITIDKAEYNRLMRSDKLLMALRNLT